MNKLSQTIVGTTALKAMPSLASMIRPEVLDKYVIPDSFYDVYFRTLKTKKHVLLNPAIEMAKSGKIKFFNSSDPLDPKNKPIAFPNYFSVFVFKNQKGEYVSYVNAAAKAGYRRDKSGEAIGTSLDENSVQLYLIMGAAARILADKDKELTNNTKFVSLCAEMHAKLMNICIDTLYPISGDTRKFIILNFLSIMYFLQFHARYTVEQALPLALKAKTVDSTIIKTDSITFASGNLKMTSIVDFLKILEHEFSFIKKGSIDLRALETTVVMRFGQPAILFLEHFQSFINMIESVDLMGRIYKDKYTKNQFRPTDIANLNQILLVASDI